MSSGPSLGCAVSKLRASGRSRGDVPLEPRLRGQSVRVCVEGRRREMLCSYFVLLSKISPYGVKKIESIV